MGQFRKQTIRHVDLTGQTVLVRVDYNVPFDEAGRISNDFRIRASLPTLRRLLEQHCKIVLISHLGRPVGRDAKYSLRPVAERLSVLLSRPVHFVDDCVGDRVKQEIASQSRGSITMLENLRFYREEAADDMSFARSLVRSSTASIFVQEAFGAAHRAHASTHAITLFLPSLAGLLLEKEVRTLSRVMSHPSRPLVALIGGAKISDKIPLIQRLVSVADRILIGGAMANTFLAARGMQMGASRLEVGQLDTIREIYRLAEAKVGKYHVDEFLVLPRDVAVADSLSGSVRQEVNIDDITSNMMALDIGKQTVEDFCRYLADAATIIWNGPLGYHENPTFAVSSARIAAAIAHNEKAISVLGGGDTVEFILQWDEHALKQFSHISTGGGASLELMSGKALPGVENLLDAHGIR